MRIKVIKDKGKYTAGQVVNTSKKVALRLIQTGHAIITKDITEKETKRKK